VEPRQLGGRYKWNRHAERGVGEVLNYGINVPMGETTKITSGTDVPIPIKA
jgi:hypothetical protein